MDEIVYHREKIDGLPLSFFCSQPVRVTGPTSAQPQQQGPQLLNTILSLSLHISRTSESSNLLIISGVM